MQTFDVSVNVLNSNVLSDRLLWKERAGGHSLPATERIQEIADVYKETAPSGCNLRTREIPLEMSLLTLLCTALIVSIVLWNLTDRTHVQRVDTLIREEKSQRVAPPCNQQRYAARARQSAQNEEKS